MSKSRIYILQGIGVLLLLGCYLMGDRPDRLSMMQFDSTSPSVIKKHHLHIHSTEHQAHLISSSHNSDRQKTELPKHISFEPMVAPVATIQLVTFSTAVITHDEPLMPEYKYLFYEEINPPPPKC